MLICSHPWVYFSNVFNEVRTLFTLRQGLRDQIQLFFVRIPAVQNEDLNQQQNITSSQTKTTFVGVHVRRSDMVAGEKKLGIPLAMRTT